MPTIDCKFQKGFSAQASPAAFTPSGGDVSAAGIGVHSNRVLLVQVSGNITALTGITVTWNGVAMTLISGPFQAVSFDTYLYGLKTDANIATGDQSLSVSWTGGAVDITVGAISIYDADTTIGWQNLANGSGTSTAPTLDITSTNGNLAVVVGCNNNGTAPTIAAGTSAWIEGDLNGNYFGGYRASTTGTTTITWTTGSVEWVTQGVDVPAFVASGARYILGTH